MQRRVKAQQRTVLLVLITNPQELAQRRHQVLRRQAATIPGLLIAAITVPQGTTKAHLPHQAKMDCNYARVWVQDATGRYETVESGHWKYDRHASCHKYRTVFVTRENTAGNYRSVFAI